MHAKDVLASFAAFLFLISPAAAADIGDMPAEAPTVAHERSFYIRGDIGIASYGTGGFHQDDVEDRGGSFISHSISDAPYIGAGFGWQLTKHFRVDFTGEYRASADVKAVDYLQETLTAPDGVVTASTTYEGEHSAFVGMANLYVDLFTVRGFTPYVGGGIGFAHNRMKDFTTISTGSFEDATTGDIRSETTNGIAGDSNKTNFAWALMAGTSYDLSPNAKLDLGYRYLNLGGDIAATTDLINCVCGTIGSPLKAADLDAHEFRIGIRWELGGPERATHDPLK